MTEPTLSTQSLKQRRLEKRKTSFLNSIPNYQYNHLLPCLVNNTMWVVEEEEQSTTWWERWKIKITTWGQEERTAGACRIYRPACIYTIAIEPFLGCHATTARDRPFSGFIWATYGVRDNSTPARSYLSYYIQISLRSSTILYFSTDRQNGAKFPSLKCTHISLWLNPTGHSKFHNTSNHPPPATDSGRTARTPLYPPVQAVPLLPPTSPPPPFSCPVSRTEEPVPVQACATTDCTEYAR